MTLSVVWTLLGIAVLIGVNGLYVATEFALIGARRERLESFAREGRRAARRVLALLSDVFALDRAIASIQVGITAASLGLGMFAEHAVARLIQPVLEQAGAASGVATHGLAVAISVAGLTFLHVALGEVVPKSIALLDASRAALLLHPVLNITQVTLRPFVAALAGASRITLGLMHVEAPDETDRALSLDELEDVIEASGSGGVLGERHAALLRRLLAFEDLRIRKTMVPRNRVAGLPVTAGAAEVVEMIRRTRHSRYAVYGRDLDDIVGYVHAKDILRAQTRPEPFDLAALVRPVLRVPETASATRLLRLFRRHRAHLAVIYDEHGGTAGIVMPDDLIEEIFGEVQDEFDADEPAVRRIGPTRARVRGDARLDEVNKALGLALEEPHVDTIGGLIVARLGRLAVPDDRIRLGRVTLKVERVAGHAVRSVWLSWTSEP
ncbi:MAG: hemolysin family protein [Acidobacteriota bacterium]